MIQHHIALVELTFHKPNLSTQCACEVDKLTATSSKQ
uniref:Uncharacterized protein n=1 Tax=Arundo donax TaxID=35708 RepID=A0A0A9BH66_ARUDO